MSNIYKAYLLGQKLAVANQVPNLRKEEDLTSVLSDLATLAADPDTQETLSEVSTTEGDTSSKATWGSKLDLDPDQAKEV
jgi:hypothetical protein